MKRHLERWQWMVATSLGALLVMAPVAARAATVAPAAEVASVPSPSHARAATDRSPTSDQNKRKQLEYAQREAKDPAAAAYKGGYGGGIYISGGAVVVLLVVVLIVVLL